MENVGRAIRRGFLEEAAFALRSEGGMGNAGF